jgi:hypothetical protein
VVGLALGAAAVLIAFIDGVTGINARFAGGHFASSAGIGVSAHNMWRLKTLLPVLGYIENTPSASNYYMHHPLGVFWTVAALGKVLGFSNWVLRLPPLIYVTATPYFLYRIGRELWGPIEGGLSALAFVALPITLAYTSYHDLEQPVMFGCVVASWAYLRLVRTWKDRYAVISALGFFFALNHDWQAYIWGVFFLGWLFVRGFLLPERALGAVRARAFGRYWALMCVAAGLALGIEIVALNESGQLSDLLGSFFARSSGSGTPLELVLAGRRYRIELMFTGLGIFLGKLAVPVIVARFLLKRDELELLPIPLLLSALVQYLGFKQGADVHIFWPHPFATYFGLAVGALAASVRETAEWTCRRYPFRVPGAARRLAPWLGLVLVGLPIGLVLKDGLFLSRLSSETGGRFAEANLDLYVDEAQALRWFRQRVPEKSGVAYHDSILASYALQWEARPGPFWARQPVAAPPAQARTLFLDSRGTSLGDLRVAAGKYHVYAVESFWLVDLKEPPAPLSGYRFDEHEPSLLEGLSLGRVEPVRTVVEDPWVTWEWRTLLGQPAQEPTAAPSTAEQLRVAHNVAVARGDAAAVSRWQAALSARLNWQVHASWDNGTELLGAIRHTGAQRGFTFYFRAGTFKTDARFSVFAKVVSPPRFSTLPMDPAELDLTTNPIWPTTLWKPGGIYSVKVVFRKRPGTERLTASWSGGVHRSDASTPLDLGRF